MMNGMKLLILLGLGSDFWFFRSFQKGYHLEHNFGHGKEHLSGFLFTLNILAFLFHTVLEFLDENYAKAREKSPRAEFFKEIEVLTKHFYFDDWDTLMLFMIRDRDSPMIHASDFI